MKAKAFIEGVKIPTRDFIEKIHDNSYISWATAVALAGRPRQEVVLFEGQPFLTLFGGAVVAVDSPVGERLQRTWLPVLAGNHAPIPLSALTPRDISDAIMRCRAKAAAMVNGVGLSVYAGFEGDAFGFLKALGIKPDSDLSQVTPLTEDKGGVKYVPWAAALAAARITDPEFFWEVIEFDVTDPETGEVRRLPVAQVAGGWLVAVRVVYKGQEHTEWLPIMGVAEVPTKRGTRKMDHQPLANPGVFEWNKSVMRCLTKAIAVASGYSLSIYAGEDLAAIKAAQEIAQRKPAKPAVVVQEAPNPQDEDRNVLLTALKEEIAADASMLERVLRGVVTRGWVDVQPASIEDLVATNPNAARKLLDALKAKRKTA